MKYTREERDRLLEEADRWLNGHERGRVLRQARAADIQPEKIEWLWPGRLARGKITLLEGDPGLGKSTLTIDIAAKLSTGTRLPWGVEIPPTGTLFMSAEDGVADTIVPRLIAAGADMTRIWIVDGIDTDEGEAGVQIPRDLNLIEEAMTRQDCSLVVVDPLSVFLGDEINENKNQEVRKALAPAKAMFERAKVAGLLLRHLTKSQSANPVYRGAGSIGLGGAARFVMMVGEDPEIPDVKVLANVKENIRTRDRVPSLTFQVVSAETDPDTAKIAWTGETRWKARDLQMVDGEEGEALKEAKEWLADYLRGGIMAQAKQVLKEANANGHAERTIYRAKKALRIRSVKDGAGAWGWKMEDCHEDCQTNIATPHAHDGDVGNLGNLPENTHNNTSSDSSVGNVFGNLQRSPWQSSKDANTANIANAYEGSDPPW
jgi:archaellum biogenesis ATPase FlaH